MAEILSRIIEVCIFRLNRNRPEYLLLRRSSREEVYPGLWQFVSGRVKPGEDAGRAARRELKEETGFGDGMLWTVPYVISFYDPAADAVNMNPFFAFKASGSAEPVLSPEHDLHQWLEYDEAVRRLVWPGHRQGLEIVKRFVVEGEAAGPLTVLRS